MAYDTYTPRIAYAKVELIEVPKDDKTKPKFTQTFYSSSIVEGWKSQTAPFLWIPAHYWDLNSLSYEIISSTTDSFRVNSRTGQLYVITALDREAHDKVNLKIRGKEIKGTKLKPDEKKERVKQTLEKLKS